MFSTCSRIDGLPEKNGCKGFSRKTLWYAAHIASTSAASGSGKPSIFLSVSAVNDYKLAYQQFHLLTGFPTTGFTSVGTSMMDDQLCYREPINDTFLRLQVSLQHMPKARSGLVWVFRRSEKKVGGSFGSYNNSASSLMALLEFLFGIVWL